VTSSSSVRPSEAEGKGRAAEGVKVVTAKAAHAVPAALEWEWYSR